MDHLSSLRHALQALAQDAVFQESLLSSWLEPPAELPERVVQAWRHLLASDQPFTENQVAAIEALFAHFKSFSGPDHANHWVESALPTSRHWSTARRLASGALEKFGWFAATPPVSRELYGEDFSTSA
jgi:hypothetical protein